MSGFLKKIGKVFKKVGKVLKKVALPALAIGAIVLTGGAALGVLPSVGSMVGGLGLGPVLTGALTTGAQGALAGAATSLVTGGDPLKGAVTGMGIGAALGGAGAALGGTGAAGAASGATPASSSGGIQVTMGQSGMDPAMNGAAGALSGAAQTAAPAAIQSAGGGLGSFLNRNPTLTAGLIQGIGAGLSSAAQAKALREADQRDYDNTLGYSGLSGSAPTIADPGYMAYDPQSGTIKKVGA